MLARGMGWDGMGWDVWDGMSGFCIPRLWPVVGGVTSPVKCLSLLIIKAFSLDR